MHHYHNASADVHRGGFIFRESVHDCAMMYATRPYVVGRDTCANISPLGVQICTALRSTWRDPNPYEEALMDRFHAPTDAPPSSTGAQ